MTSTEPQPGKGLREVRIGVWATEEQAFALVERIAAVLCPEPEHAGPCEMPWSIGLVGPEDIATSEDPDPYPELIAQARIEGTW